MKGPINGFEKGITFFEFLSEKLLFQFGKWLAMIKKLGKKQFNFTKKLFKTLLFIYLFRNKINLFRCLHVSLEALYQCSVSVNY